MESGGYANYGRLLGGTTFIHNNIMTHARETEREITPVRYVRRRKSSQFAVL
jgi:hypothetical protein